MVERAVMEQLAEDVEYVVEYRMKKRMVLTSGFMTWDAE